MDQLFADAAAWLTTDHIWTTIGFLGQFLFGSRFLIQWFKSEQVGRSVIPLSFWYCSVAGGVVLLAYAIYKMDPVFITGQGMGLIVYGRNLFLIFRERRTTSDAKLASPAPTA